MAYFTYLISSKESAPIGRSTSTLQKRYNDYEKASKCGCNFYISKCEEALEELLTQSRMSSGKRNQTSHSGPRDCHGPARYRNYSTTPWIPGKIKNISDIVTTLLSNQGVDQICASRSEIKCILLLCD